MRWIAVNIYIYFFTEIGNNTVLFINKYNSYSTGRNIPFLQCPTEAFHMPFVWHTRPLSPNKVKPALQDTSVTVQDRDTLVESDPSAGGVNTLQSVNKYILYVQEVYDNSCFAFYIAVGQI